MTRSSLPKPASTRMGIRIQGERFPPEKFVPSPNQGTIAVVSRADPSLREVLSALDHPQTRTDVMIERAVMEQLGGGCFTPLGIYCRAGHLIAEVLSLDGTRAERIETDVKTIDEAREQGRQLRTRAQGLIDEAYKQLGIAGDHVMKGKVYLVGSGPGGTAFLTQRGRAVIDKADVVLFDQLPGEEILASLPDRAEKIDCGKYGGKHTLEQDEIEALMVDRAKKGKLVVRLKGGDPFLFGRGGEELETVRAAGIPVEMVPGISSALAVPASVGIPLTHRKYASQVTILTGNEDPTKPGPALDWELLAKSRGTIVILMGVANLAKIADALMKNGKPEETPVAIIERGLRIDRRVTTGTLATIAAVAKKAGVKPPAVIVIGDVVKLYDPENPGPDTGRRGWMND